MSWKKLSYVGSNHENNYQAINRKADRRLEAFRATGASLLFIPKGALTHHPQSGRWYPSFVGHVRSLRTIHRMLLKEGQTMPQIY
ncbi:MAG: hypothetical protein IJV14_05190 [Lachnospiraceae bacterium]|nr:hypothetical protein [Lachnospiraceae bacterium]